MLKKGRQSLYDIFTEISRLHYQLAHVLLDEIGIYPGQPPLLLLINEEEGQSQRELADRLNISPATLTVMLGRMEKASLVKRKQDINDQRISRVYLTHEGKEICTQAIKITKKLKEECFANLTMEEQVILRRLLLQVRDNLLNKIN